MGAEKTSPWNTTIVAMLVGVFTNAAASTIGMIALGKQIYDLTHSDLNLGLLGLAEFAPSAFLVLVTGAVADRFRRTRVGALSSMVEVAAGASLALYTLTRPHDVRPIFALVLLFGTGRAFFNPVSRALPADVVSAERLPWLTARRAASWQAAIIVGPVIGGALYVVDPAAPYIAMAALMVVASAAMLVMDAHGVWGEPRAGAKQERAGLRDAFEGLRFIRSTPILFAAISLDLFAVLFGGAVALLPAIATDRLGAGAVGLGWLRAAGGIGAALTTVVIVRWPVTKHVGRTLLLVVAVFGIGTVALGVTRTYAVAFAAMAVLTGADAVSVFIRSTLVPLATPFDKRGRVLAVESVFIGASNELGAFESGVAGQLLGTAPAVVLGGAATLAIAGLYAVAFPALRSLQRFPVPVNWTRDGPATGTVPGVRDDDA